ncbi:[acyl-carrier-protein] S-malonyltransferase [Haloactinopolyspora alba]|uniref:Malonyl CoA-acyl carrier protein transacylase n=1 Tax=Haloactinopolyspora alba TaxID=648780 RepID=A0A2P8DYS3_9ACTN|nr:ACP S-malonyltransferase [Haloactinopolyspora alba]PSL02370.1 [acyl-carrier-protein] S-malonyltransferase [Haloactinopolyspora alba]
MTRTAHIFPGQGSQRVGMGRDLADQHPRAAELFAAADEVLGFELSRLCWEGPEEELRRTEITQPALFVASLAMHRVLDEYLPPPVVVAGHSLGEYTALVAAGVLDWTSALRLVRRRGELMAAVNESTPGAMAAVIGPAAAQVERWCAAAGDGHDRLVEIANHNDDTQTVVSGTVAGVAALTEHARTHGPADTRVTKLGVGAPFHCSLMRPVEAEFARELDAVEFATPRIPVVSNVDASTVTTGRQARSALRAQLAGAVRWRESMDTIAGHGVDAFVEAGPGRVLTGLCRRSRPDITCHSASDARRVDRLVAELAVAQPA